MLLPSSTSPAKPYLPEQIFDRLKLVIDPELSVDIVSLGLIYAVDSSWVASPTGQVPTVHVIMTLTTPGCPLAAVFDTMVRESLVGLPCLDADHHVTIEVTFDPPWVPDLMSEEAKAELGFD